MQAGRWFDRSWIVWWGLVSSIWCVTAAERLSATFDEPHYIKHGLHAWRSGSYHPLLRGGTMPLPIDAQLLPVFVWEEVRGRPFNLDTEFGTVLETARAGNLVFWWLLLYFSWRLARRFGGDWAGRLTVPLIACDPNFLAHAALATTDIAVSACVLAFTHVFLSGREGNWRQRVLLPGLCFGAGLLAKASALPFAVLIMGIFELHRTWARHWDPSAAGNPLAKRARALWGAIWAFRWDFWQIIGLGMLTAFAYCGSDWRTDPGWRNWANTLPEGSFRDVMLYLAEHVRIFPNAGVGLVYQFQHNFRGHGAYVVGEWHTHSVWYYFPLAMTMKLTLPVLLLLAVTLAFRPRSYSHALGLLAAFLILFTLNCRVQIGIRLILPVLSFLFIALAVALAKGWPEHWPTPSRAFGLAAACLVLAVPMLRIWPHGLCYFNELWGGPENGYRYLSDSNYDWGQGLSDLDRWRAEHGQPPLKICYFGADPRARQSPDLLLLHKMTATNEEELRARVGGGYLAVGATLLYSNPALVPNAEPVIGMLRAKKPVGRTMTFFIYDFSEPTKLVATP